MVYSHYQTEINIRLPIIKNRKNAGAFFGLSIDHVRTYDYSKNFSDWAKDT